MQTHGLTNQAAGCIGGMDAQREKAQGIVKDMRRKHGHLYSAWNWLEIAMKATPPNEEEEAGLWELLCRARNDRY